MNSEHGEVSIEVIDNIIIVRAVGAFNEFGAQKYTNAIRTAVNCMQKQRFSILINNLKFLGGTPEAYQELEDYNAWLNQKELIGKAMVITSNITLDVINKLSPSRAMQQTKNFDNENDAMNWLKSLN